MEKRKMPATVMGIMLFIISGLIHAQEAGQKSKFTTGVDLYSSYIFRGTRFGEGPSFQPSVKFLNGGFTAGVWGSFDVNGYSEADPYISFTFPFGLSLGITDYYFPGSDFFDVSRASGNQAFEINSGFSRGGFSLSGNYIINEAGGAASMGGDMYFQAGYTFRNVNIYAGAGNGWHTSDGEFDFCNIGLGTTKELNLSDKLSIPLTGVIILNPDRGQLFVIAGFSF